MHMAGGGAIFMRHGCSAIQPVGPGIIHLHHASHLLVKLAALFLDRRNNLSPRSSLRRLSHSWGHGWLACTLENRPKELQPTFRALLDSECSAQVWRFML